MRADGHPIESEIVSEKAAALARVTAQLEDALAAYARGGADAERVDELRRHAAERLWFLIVQREVLGLRDHEAIFRFYQIPPEVRRAMGPNLRSEAPAPRRA